MAHNRLIDVTLDASTLSRWSAEVEHERRVAIYDLLEDNHFRLLKTSRADYRGPYRLHLATQDGRLIFCVRDEEGLDLMIFQFALSPLRKVIRDYFAVCDSYYDAIRTKTPAQIEAIDMGRRGLHNEGSLMLRDRLADKIHVDDLTARRLFTLICALHMKGGAIVR